VAGSENGIEIRLLTTVAEFDDVVELQQEVWGFEEIELLPMRFFVVANKVGGHVFGAYDGQRMIAFCLAIPGIKPGPRPYLHSHMLGVLPEYRDRGIGRALKIRQREDALARGITLIEWTFDPLELKNAYFNIVRLGAIVRRFQRNQYGTTTSRLHGGLPTDRCTAEWWIGAPAPAKPYPIARRIALPAGIGEIKRADLDRALIIQDEVATQFENAFANKLTVVGMERTPETASYLLTAEPLP
jgi:predicted GNAT superfamily acetyltransferase